MGMNELWLASSSVRMEESVDRFTEPLASFARAVDEILVSFPVIAESASVFASG